MSTSTRRRWLVAPAAALVALAVGLARGEQHEDGFEEVRADALTWTDLEVPGLPPGLKTARLHGDPTAGDETFAFRLFMPDGYRIPLHWHPADENVTVIEGRFLLGMGEEADWERMQAYAPGDFLHIPTPHRHYAAAEGDTIVQIHSHGRWALILVRPPEPAGR
ncbi:MAG: cupin domain-containing protein [Planctomycetes bacterium]|nr:cupin domain-containing protein [Planctomycetota bacterium]